jgi:N-acylglucosamine 2-epimerase
VDAGRGGWLFAHICNVFGKNEQYRAMAQSAIDFAKKHCIDPADGRMYFLVGSDGTPVRKRRYVFSEYFYCMANAEYYGLTGETGYLEEARNYHALVAAIWEDPSRTLSKSPRNSYRPRPRCAACATIWC